jgi:hypothetical protein
VLARGGLVFTLVCLRGVQVLLQRDFKPVSFKYFDNLGIIYRSFFIQSSRLVWSVGIEPWSCAAIDSAGGLRVSTLLSLRAR